MFQHPAVNPFSLLMDPAEVLRAVERSPTLSNLQARVFRPLDGRGPQAAGAPAEWAAFDAEVDASDFPMDVEDSEAERSPSD